MFFVYIAAVIICSMLICAIEADSGFTSHDIVFEVVSAIGTVGLSCGITGSLSAASQIIIIFLMFFGRVGGFTFILVFSGERKPVEISRIADNIIMIIL